MNNDNKKKEQLDLLLNDDYDLSTSEAEMATQIAKSLTDSDHRSWYLSQVARKMAHAKWWDSALQVANSAINFYDRMDALLAIAGEIIKGGESQTAIPILKEVIKTAEETKSSEVWPWQRAETLNRAATLFKQLGDMDVALRAWDKAVRIAQAGQNYDTDCPSVLAEITRELALAGQMEFAKHVADSIQSIGKREYALKQIDGQK